MQVGAGPQDGQGCSHLTGSGRELGEEAPHCFQGSPPTPWNKGK